MNRLGLYIHIPFCASKCDYCDFYSLPAAGRDIEAYTQALVCDIEKTSPGCGDMVVDSVYFGGGTPSCIGAARLTCIFGEIKRNFSLGADAEVTLEANPESASKEFLDETRGAGFNRVSFGVQSFSNRELAALGRLHDERAAEQAVILAAECGYDNISIDLMYGIPYQTDVSWRASLERAVRLPIKHISVYALRPERGTRLFESELMARLPDDDTQADLYLAAVSLLAEHGFIQYEISNFARDGCVSRHNMKYWDMEEYIGFGPGAHSDFMGRRWGVVRDIAAYTAGAWAGGPPISERSNPSQAERLQEHIMLALRTAKGLRLKNEKYGRDFAVLLPLMKKLEAEGKAVLNGEHFYLKPEGFLVSNIIITDFWEKLNI